METATGTVVWNLNPINDAWSVQVKIASGLFAGARFILRSKRHPTTGSVLEPGDSITVEFCPADQFATPIAA